MHFNVYINKNKDNNKYYMIIILVVINPRKLI